MPKHFYCRLGRHIWPSPIELPLRHQGPFGYQNCRQCEVERGIKRSTVGSCFTERPALPDLPERSGNGRGARMRTQAELEAQAQLKAAAEGKHFVTEAEGRSWWLALAGSGK